ncbi:hypothetical protein OO015_08530 [Thermomicrobium sp. 4228-Ro]|uniref:hypothetical protein n=1 Tax=Thermomicrobium sp. 4228-Ro TaxID=2993937 RepID=UPI0022489FB2|nr:hypothetical protein [Thermomicrobium sp. 4228-Ro]MCX2727539.1 hypothetical protein [Thermomicrobium sp. 4228-Ro]
MTERYESRTALEPIVHILRAAGYWAYSLYGEDGRWLVACDTEAGRVDVRVGRDGYLVEVWDVSPGLFYNEEDERRRVVHERLARLTLARLAETIRRAPLEPGEELLADLWWDDNEHGVGARLSLEIPFSASGQLPSLVEILLEQLNALIARVEERLLD